MEWKQIRKFIQKEKVTSAIFENIKTGEVKWVSAKEFKDYL